MKSNLSPKGIAVAVAAVVAVGAFNLSAYNSGGG